MNCVTSRRGKCHIRKQSWLVFSYCLETFLKSLKYKWFTQHSILFTSLFPLKSMHTSLLGQIYGMKSFFFTTAPVYMKDEIILNILKSILVTVGQILVQSKFIFVHLFWTRRWLREKGCLDSMTLYCAEVPSQIQISLVSIPSQDLQELPNPELISQQSCKQQNICIQLLWKYMGIMEGV